MRPIRAFFCTCLLLSALACSQKDGQASAPSAEVSVPRWVDGQTYTYRVDLTNEAKVASRDVGARVSGTLHVAVRSRATETELALSYGELSAMELKDGALVESPSLTSALRRPFSVVMRDGQAQAFRLAKGVSAEQVGLPLALASALSLVKGTAGESSWSSEERDLTGKFKASYGTDPRTGELVKHKQSYVSLSMLAGGLGAIAEAQTPTVESSAVRIRVRDGALEHLSSDETLRLPLMGKEELRSHTVVELALLGHDTRATDFGPLDSETTLLTFDQLKGRGPDDARFDGERIGAFSYETALAQLEVPLDDAPGTVAYRERFAKHQAAFQALFALFRSEPETLARAEAAVLTGSRASISIIGAFGALGSDAAQAALARIIDAPLSNELRASAMRVLVQTEKPSEDAVRFVSAMLGDPARRDLAAQGLGVMARSLREHGEAERSERLSRTLVSGLEEAQSNDARVRYLHGLSNAGYSAGFSAVARRLADESAEVRAAAVEALRLMDDARVDGVIAGALSDADSQVRNAALMAAAVRAPSPVLNKALISTLSDKNSNVRQRAIRLAASFLPKAPELEAPLRAVANTDESPELRALALSTFD